MGNRLHWLTTIIFVSIAAIVVSAFGLSCSHKGYSGPVESISIGVVGVSETDGLMYIASDMNFFTDNGLNVTVKGTYSTGVEALNSLMKNEIDIGTAAEYGVVRNAFTHSNISIVVSKDKTVDFSLHALKDHGIQDIADLKGKSIGFSPNTIQAFYVARFLQLNGISLRDVNTVDVSDPQSLDALQKGYVDAVVSTGANTYRIEQQLADTVVTWSIQSSQPSFSVYVARNEWITQHPEIIKRVLKSLSQAQDYLIKNPVKALALLQKHLNYDDAYMVYMRVNHEYSLSLDKSLIIAMEDEARWMIKNKLTKEKILPNFLDYIYEDGLKAVKPEAVNIIR
jgi:NitT/TauT family transport system substrate-binding protein